MHPPELLLSLSRATIGLPQGRLTLRSRDWIQLYDRLSLAWYSSIPVDDTLERYT
jgi:hypothetical protein